MPELLVLPPPPTLEISNSGTFFVTGGTYLKQHYFRTADRLEVLQRGLLKVAADQSWQLEAWAVFSNHYHFVAHAPAGEEGKEAGAAESLRAMLGELHERTARWIAARERIPPAKVWFNFWETELTFPGSYLARVAYVFENAVKHGLVAEPAEYAYCSASWLEQRARSAQLELVRRYRGSRINVVDDYRPELATLPEPALPMSAAN